MGWWGRLLGGEFGGLGGDGLVRCSGADVEVVGGGREESVGI